MHLLYLGVMCHVLIPLFASSFWNESSPMNRSDRGKTKGQIASKKQAVVWAGKEWIELDDDGLRVPSRRWQQMGKDLAVCTLTLRNDSLTDFNCFIWQGGKVSTPSIYGCYPKDFCHKKREYKAEDWANLLHHYSLPLFYQNLETKVYLVLRIFALLR